MVVTGLPVTFVEIDIRNVLLLLDNQIQVGLAHYLCTFNFSTGVWV